MTADAYADLREQLRATTQAAQRLVREAAGAAGPATEAAQRPTPAAGWAGPAPDDARPPELQALIAVVAALRPLVPDELQTLVRDVLRQVLLLARALVDGWIERVQGLNPAANAQPVVEEIPIT